MSHMCVANVVNEPAAGPLEACGQAVGMAGWHGWLARLARMLTWLLKQLWALSKHAYKLLAWLAGMAGQNANAFRMALARPSVLEL